MVLRQVLAAGMLLLAVTAVGRGQQGNEDLSKLYRRGADFAETIHLTRAALAPVLRDAAEAESVTLGPWHATEPLAAKGLAEALFPEHGIDLTGKDPSGRPLWQKRAEYADGVSHTLAGEGRNSVCVYLFRTISARQATKLPAGLGSDDGIEVFLNGTRIHSNDAARGVAADSDRVMLDLKAGQNALLIKIYNRGGGHGFYFSAISDPAVVLWRRIAGDFPTESAWALRDLEGEQAQLLRKPDASIERRMLQRVLSALGPAAGSLRSQSDDLVASSASSNDRRWIDLYLQACQLQQVLTESTQMNVAGLRAAIADLVATFGAKYPKGTQYLARLDELEKRSTRTTGADRAMAGLDLMKLRNEALLANPLIDFDRLLLVKRSPREMGLPQNWQGNCALPRNGYDNEIAILSPVSPEGKLTTLFKPEGDKFVGDIDLHFDAGRMLFSMPGKNGRWQVHEVNTDGSGLRQVTPGEEPDVDNYDPCYLPNGRIMYASTLAFHGVPCVGGGNTVANLVVMDADGRNARQLTFDQDHNWCPTVMHDGRVMYTRWEYSDTAHYFTRILFRMNPDGTGQMAHYGSNSYWPNSLFYARPVPNHDSKVVAVVSGHHGVARMGELVVLDPMQGRTEADGAVQRIPGYQKPVDPIIRDGLVDGSWPKFLHPYPLSDKHFLVSMQPKGGLWGIYLVDVFDNTVLLCQQPGWAMLEPVPVQKTSMPPIVPDRVDLKSREATVYMQDVYLGPGLKDVPRGTVKSLRVYEPHYGYPGMGGHIHIGVDGPWDARRIIGTVPVNEDGSAAFKVPANTPLAVQPLDEEGKALQVMRSWFTAMPGETLSCVGCHESMNDAPPAKNAALYGKPAEIVSWHGPARGFSFKREVQPVLDRHCVGCHDGKARDDGRAIPDFTAKAQNGWNNFTPSYLALHPYVRRPGPESDYHMQVPLEWHANTSELVQMLKKGHHGVQLDAEAWDRLITWIDLNVPDHGTWGEHRKIPGKGHERRLAMRTKYANNPIDPEAIPDMPRAKVEFLKPQTPVRPALGPLAAAGWPFDASEAQRRQGAAGLPPRIKVDVGEGVQMDLVLIPAGEFVMGAADGAPDEWPQSVVKIDRPFYMGMTEVTNAQFKAFDSAHDSRYISVFNKDQSTPGETANRPTQPVIRVSWNQAMAFCDWMSKRTGRKVCLPTEAQWEYACRAGTQTPLPWGAVDADFSKLANLADERLNNLARGDSPKWIPVVTAINDGSIVTDHVGRYRPNPFGLLDMNGNAAEWTQSAYRPYPYRDDDGRNDVAARVERVVRGGSFYDRPHRATSSFRLAYRPYAKVWNTGFRVMVEPD